MSDYTQISIYDILGLKPVPYKFDKPIRLIELFGGIGAQAMALKRLQVPFEHYRLVEFDKYAIKSYNSIHGTDFTTTDIRDVKGPDLGITDTHLYTYLMTYSFPCQDLSVAGKQKGMTKGSGTRSGLLWEVERLLNETNELPQVLLMENVPQVHSKANIPDFEKWLSFLEYKGYTNFWQDLNAKDYGVAQSRNRCFCVSLLGNYSYTFPEKIPLDKCMKDYLEDEVDEKYYLKGEKVQELIDKLIKSGNTLTDRQTDRQTIELSVDAKSINESRAIMSRQDRGISYISGQGSGVFEHWLS